MSVEVKAQNTISMTSVKAIKDATDEANTLLDSMRQSAEDAGTTLNGIYQDAEDAKNSAKEADVQAQNATTYALGAQTSLSEIEKVVDVLNWIAEHGNYQPTNDTDVNNGKFYFELVNGEYQNITPVCNPYLQGYYELATSTWELSSDTTVDMNKDYYSRSGSGTVGDPYVYTYISSPTGNPHDNEYYELASATYIPTSDTSVVIGKLYFTRTGMGTVGDPYVYSYVEPEANPYILGLYELTDVDTSISNYVASHIVLVNDGLIIQTDGISSKVKISGSGVKLMNEHGNVIATFSDTITLGDATKAHLALSAGDDTTTPPVLPELAFWNGTSKVAYINSDTLSISKAQITQTLKIGQFVWKVQDANRISLVYSP